MSSWNDFDFDAVLATVIYYLSYVIGYLYQLYISFSTNHEQAYQIVVACLAVYIAFKAVLAALRFVVRWSKFAIQSIIVFYAVTIALSYFTGQSVPTLMEGNPAVQELLVLWQHLKMIISLAYNLARQLVSSGQFDEQFGHVAPPNQEYYAYYERVLRNWR